MNEPYVVHETAEWVLVFKPHGMVSAPLSVNEKNTLLAWFLERYPEAALVTGIKNIECGLIHRLDTATEGLVLIARTQVSWEYLWQAQQSGLIVKKYFALCSPKDTSTLPGNGTFPIVIESRFRAFGPGRREVRPIFPGMKGFEAAGKSYRTVITDATYMDTLSAIGVSCTITQGFRHQIRTHLAFSGFPILGDTLYNPLWANPDNDRAAAEIPLQLHAIGISFPDMSAGERAVFSLPQPDKMTR